MKIPTCLYLLFLLLAMLSCDEDSFSRVVEIDIPDHESKLVVNALLVDNSPLLRIEVSHSEDILTEQEIVRIAGATVRLLENGRLLGHAVEDEHEPGVYNFSIPADIRTGQEFEIQVEAPGYPNVQVRDVVPLVVPIAVVHYKKNGGVTQDGRRMDLIAVEFVDPPGAENYYAIDAKVDAEVYFVDPNGDTTYFENSQHLYLESTDPLNEYSYNFGTVFNDAAFDGRSVRVEVLTRVWKETEFLTVSLVSMSENSYRYDRSLTHFRDADGNPFAEPVTVHSNVEGGYGIFAVNRISSTTLPVHSP